MEKAVLNVSSLRITQGMNEPFSHKNCLAIDIAGHGNFRAPFTGTIKKIYTKDANQVWLESNEKVLYADGTIDYMTLSIWHDNDVSNLSVGKVIKQNEIFYQEGTKGYVTGKHNHVTVGKGKFTGSGWYENEKGQAWCINNQYPINKALFLYKDVKIENDYGYKWERTSDFVVNEITPNVKRDETKNQVEVIVDQLRVRTEPSLKGTILGFAKRGFYNVLDQKQADGYLWYKIANNQWIATDKEWTIYYPASDYKTLYEQEVQKNVKLQEQIVSLTKEKENLQSKIDKAIADLK